MGHVGLVDSLAFLADALGCPVDKVDDSIAPVLTKKVVRTTLVSGNRSKLRKLVCQSGTATGWASLFFVRDSILVGDQE